MVNLILHSLSNVGTVCIVSSRDYKVNFVQHSVWLLNVVILPTCLICWNLLEMCLWRHGECAMMRVMNLYLLFKNGESAKKNYKFSLLLKTIRKCLFDYFLRTHEIRFRRSSLDLVHHNSALMLSKYSKSPPIHFARHI